MSEVSNNLVIVPQRVYDYNNKKVITTTQSIPLDEFYRRESRKNNGLIEKFYNWAKNLTGLGVGSNKVNSEIEKAAENQTSTENVVNLIHQYNSSQENSAQLFGDVISTGAAVLSFAGINKVLNYAKSIIECNKPLREVVEKLLKDTNEELSQTKYSASSQKKLIKMADKLYKRLVKDMTSKPKIVAGSVVAATLAGGISKYWTLKFNRIGSDEFEVDKQVYGKKKEKNVDKQQEKLRRKIWKAEDKALNSKRHKTNFMNFVSGAVNGLMSPLLLLGGFVAAPVYIVGNSLNRYFIANRTDDKKSFKGYINNTMNDIIPTGIMAAAIAVPMVKNGNYIKTFNKNIKEVADKLSNAQLVPPDYSGVSAYKKLEGLMLESPNISSIISVPSMSLEEKITKLTKENIFAVKFKQISNDGDALTLALREKCPPTRTIEEAQQFINANAGTGYTVEKLLGVGTVAETYLAKDATGKEVCIKILKNGISKEKILQDKQKFVEMVKSLPDKSAEEIEYLLNNLDDLASGILKEVDLKNEMEAAKRLAKSTTVANVVRPIEVKNNVYVMERANGVSLASFLSINELYNLRKLYKKHNNSAGIEEVEHQIEELMSKMPSFKDVKCDKKDTNYILDEYRKVFVEQFYKIDKNGKSIHADIHPGNIFIDPVALKTKKGKLFTLIDTGNVIDMGIEQSLRALNFSKYVKQGNVQDIAEYVLDGAVLPKGLTKEAAVKKVAEELRKNFFDTKTKLELLNDDLVLTLTDNIMNKYKIIPSSTALNMNKSKKSAKNSTDELSVAIDNIFLSELDLQSSIPGIILKAGGHDAKKLLKTADYKLKIQEQEKKNLKQLTPQQKWKAKHNPNAPKTNSKDYLTYKLKQYILDVKQTDIFGGD